VKWQGGEEEWCCTGFSGKHYLQAFIVSEETDGANSKLWVKAATHAPKWDLIDGTWRMNRLKSQVKMSTMDLRQAASKDKLLKNIREEVGPPYLLHPEQTESIHQFPLARSNFLALWRLRHSGKPLHLFVLSQCLPIICTCMHACMHACTLALTTLLLLLHLLFLQSPPQLHHPTRR
jgi:hypothetical protein